jgi:type I restriction enzyme M protein
MPPQQPSTSSTSTNHIHSMSAVATFKTSIVRIRDILRGPGVAITGMDSMRHICLYVLARYVDMEKAKELGVPEKFAWEELMRVAQTVKGGVQFAFDLFYHKEEDCLIAHFDRLFGTEKFSFDIKSPAKHKEIMEIMNRINVHITDECMDLLGWVYEQHLGTGSSSASRDLGQYFTHRAICEYLVRLCNPGFEEDGVPESICDPTMGTGGFLTTVIKHYRGAHADKPIDWKIQCKEIHGCDTDPKVAGIARLNLFMETGGHLAENLLTHDSLYNDLPQTGYKVILANMPFGVKQLVHADCCERVKELKIRTTKSEPLFLQLMMVTLKLGGRCAVVVPDGMLVNTSNGHNGTRKYLLDNFELRRVIKMSGQFFMNTSIQPSILFFENTGNPTTVVEFWDVVRGANGDIQETMVLSVPRENLDAACSFDMRRYQEVKAAANPSGFHTVQLGDLYDVPKLIKKFNSGDMNNIGDSAFFNGKWNCPVGTHSEHSFASKKEYFVLIKDGGGDHSSHTVGMGKFFKMNGKCSVTSHNLVLIQKNENHITHQYVYYYMSLNAKALRDKARYSINLGSISISDIMEFPIQLPPLSIQQEIVATLDRIYAPGTTELAETLKLTDRAMDLVLANPGGASLEPIVDAQRLIRKSALMVADVRAQMVADVRAQMVAVMKSVGSRGFPVNPLSKISNYANGKTLSSAEKMKGGEYDVMGGGMTYNGKTNKFNREGETISISKSGSAGFVHFHNKKYWAGDCLTLVPKDNLCVSIKYLYYYLKLNDLTKSTVGSTIPHCKWDDIQNISISLPPIEFQHSVISRLDALQSQLSALETLQRQSEDNARFILDSYLM